MSWWSRIRSRRLSVGDPEIREELASHLAARIDENIAQGQSPAEARRAAERRFGSIAAIEADAARIRRRSGGFGWLMRASRASGGTLRYSVRGLLRTPVSSIAIVGALAGAIAAVVVAFAVLAATVFGRLPFRDPEQVVALRPSYIDSAAAFSPPLFADCQRETHTLDAIAAAMPWTANITSGGDPERLRGLLVTARFFETLGVEPLLGRTFRDGDGASESDRTVVISHGLWARRLGARSDILTQAVVINGARYRVVGVMPASFRWGRAYGREADGDVWAPLAFSPVSLAESERGNEYLDAYARVRRGLAAAAVQSDLDAMVRRLRDQHPDRYTETNGFRVAAVSLQREIVGRLRPMLLLLSSGAVLLLAVALTNVMGLLATRAADREREMALRIALGATPWRVAQYFVAEAVLLSAVAGGVGLSVAAVAARALERIDKVSLPRSGPIGIDWSVVAFGIVAMTAASLAMSIAPTWAAWHHNPVERIGSGTRSGQTQRATLGRRWLIVAQTAITLVLVVSAGLLVRSLANVDRTPAGFRADGVLTAAIQLPRARYPTAAARQGFVDDLTHRLAAPFGLAHVGVISELPLGGSNNTSSFDIEFAPLSAGESQRHAETWSATPAYFSTLAIPVLRGRALVAEDDATHTPVVVVSATLARRYFPGTSAIGHRLDFEGDDGRHAWREIVGVVGDVRNRQLDVVPGSQLYVPYAQRPAATFSLVAFAPGETGAALMSVRAEAHTIDHDLPIYDVATMSAIVAANTLERRAIADLMSAIAIVALLLAVLGLYALLSHSVRVRRSEFGVRVALGADARRLVRLIVGESAGVVVRGLVIGTVLALVASRLLDRFLFGIVATDPITYGVAAALFCATALIASAPAAFRASRTDPLRALRFD